MLEIIGALTWVGMAPSFQVLASVICPEKLLLEAEISYLLLAEKWNLRTLTQIHSDKEGLCAWQMSF